MEKEATLLEDLLGLIKDKNEAALHDLIERLKTEDLVYAYNRFSKDDQASLINLLS